MIRQARIYLAGGVSGTALIVAAVVGFVVLVSLQTLRDWPLNGLGGHGSGAAEENSVVAKPAGRRGSAAGAPAAGSIAGEAPGSTGQSGDGSVTTAGNGEAPSSPAAAHPVARAPGSSPDAGLGGSAQSGNSGASAQSGEPTAVKGGDKGPSLSETTAGTVNETVSGVDNATGGTLGNAGVTEGVEDVVNGAAGPNSAVGRAVDRATEAVDGLPGLDR